MMHSAFYQMRWKEQEDPGSRAKSTLSLPRNLRLHHQNNPNPWKKSSFEDDFILITEFAENEGPKAVMTIPTNGGGLFDKNAFALHVMSVDFQSQNKHSDFTIQEDTQLVLTEKTSGTFAFVHHFTLYDIHARGYVRPFCMSYIAHSKRKILSSLDTIMKEFEKIAKLFHFGNKVVFSGDVEQRLMDLLVLREEFQTKRRSRNKSKTDMEAEVKQKEHYDETLKDTKKVIDALKPHMMDSRIVDKFKKIEALAERRGHSFTSDVGTFPDDPEYSFPEQEGATSSLKKARSLSSLEEPKTGNEDSAQFKTFAPAYLRSFHQLRHLHELCGWGAKEAITRLRYVASYFSQEDIAIAVEKTESHLVGSLVKHKALKRGAKVCARLHVRRHMNMDTAQTNNHPSPSLLTLGKSVVLNFMHDVDLRKCMSAKNCSKPCVNQLLMAALRRRPSLRMRRHMNMEYNRILFSTECNVLASAASCGSTDSFKSCLEDDNNSSERSSDSMLSRFTPCASFHIELQSENYDTYDSDTTPETPTSDISTLRFDGGFHDDMSLEEFDIIEEENILKRQLSVMEIRNETEARVGPCTRKSHSLENLPSMTKTCAEGKGTENEFKIRPQKTVKHLYIGRSSIQDSEPHPGIGLVSSAKIPVSISERGEDHVTRGEKKLFSFTNVSSRKLKHEHENSGKLSPKRVLHHHRYDKLPLRCFAEEVCRSSDGPTVISGILEFRSHYSFGVHLIYALLSGRPVIIMAEAHNEREVRFLVSALWMFVLEHNGCGRTVIPWRKKPLQITDLPCLRLAGLCKSRRCVLPKSVKRYVSVLDYESGTIISPPYKGIFLSSVFNYRNCWPSNTTFIAFIHSVFLELARKAYVYYYSCCIGTDNFTSTEGSSQTQEHGEKSTINEIEVLTRLGVHFSDASIVQYFAEVIKQQQIDAHFHGNEELRAQTVIADLSKSLHYKNVAPLDP